MHDSLKQANQNILPTRSQNSSNLWLQLTLLLCATVALVLLTYALVIRYYRSSDQVAASSGSWDFSTSGDYAYDSDHILVQSGKAQLKVPWWDSNYSVRTVLKLSNTSTEALTSGITVAVTLNTSALAAIRTDCYDARIVYFNGTTNQELARAHTLVPGASDCTDSAATVFSFPLASALTAGGETGAYYLYSGYAAASAPASALGGFAVGAKGALMAIPLKVTTASVDGTAPSSSTGPARFAGSRGAFVFDGAGDYVRIPDHTSLDIPDRLTIEAWIYPQQLPDRDLYLIYRSGAYFLKLDATHHLAGGIYNGSSYVTATSTATISTDTYTHVALTFDRTSAADQVQTWISGTLDGSGTDTTAIPASASPVDLGGDSTADSYPGLMDEIRISDTVRYTASFTPSVSPFTDDTYTVMLLHGDEYGPSTLLDGKAADDGHHRNHGTLYGVSYAGGLTGTDPGSAISGQAPSGSYNSSGGLMIEEGTTNLITNPSFENSTYNTGWTSSGLTATKNTTAAYNHFGSASAKLVNSSNQNPGTYLFNLDPDATQVSISAWIYNGETGAEGSTVDASVVKLYYNDSALNTTSFTDMGGGWWKIQAEGITVSDASLTYGVEVQPESSIYLDGVQVEAKPQATTYTDGSLGSEYQWTGTANASPSTRTAQDLDFAATGHISAAAGTVTFWIKPVWNGDDGQEYFFLDTDTTSGTLSLYKSAAGNLVLSDGTNEATKDISTWEAGHWYQVAATWATGALDVYVDGAAGTGAGGFVAPTFGTDLHLGQDNTDARQANAVMGDFVLYDDALTSAEIIDLMSSRLISRSELNPSIVNSSSKPTYSALTDWVETTGAGHDGSIGYQISPDSIWWYFWTGSAWSRVKSEHDLNTATEIDTNISTFPAAAGSDSFAWQAFFSGPSPILDTLDLTYFNTPAAPENIYIDNTTALSGRANPVDLTHTTPVISAVYQDADSSNVANKVRIQISTDPTFSTISHWDNGSSGSTIADVATGDRSADIAYGSIGTAPIDTLAAGDGEVTYYLRLKFWDDDGYESSWSDTATFSMLDAPRQPTGLDFSIRASDSLTLSWNDTSTGQDQEEHYIIFHSTNGVDYTQLISLDAGTTTYQHTVLETDTLHYYLLKASNSVGDSALTEAVQTCTLARTPGAPILSNADYNTTHIILDENSNPDTVKYAVAVSTDNFVADTQYLKANGTLGLLLETSDWRTFADFGGSAGFVLGGLSANQLYTFKVKAQNSEQTETEYSSTTQITTWTSPSLNFTITGTDRGTVDLTGMNDKVQFGFVLPATTVTAVQQVSITTNASSGYTISIAADARMRIAEDPDIDFDFIKNGTVGTNGYPVPWASPTGTTIGEDTAFLGYHTSDALLGSGTTNRFAAADSWAGFDTLGQLYEILYLDGPTSGSDDGEEYCYITFKIETNNLHPTGNYTDLVVKYRLVPIF